MSRAQEGGRWINTRPSGDEFAKWFKSVRLHDGMKHEDYIGGITLVSAREKADHAEERNGQAVIRKVDQLIFVPYPKVETRVAYFWNLMLHNSSDWIGVIEPVRVNATPQPGQATALPPGFFYTAVRTSKGSTSFVNCSMRAAVYERGSYVNRVAGRDPIPLLQGVGTKQVQTLRYEDRADENALMKAETGAVGRALGMIGMLVLPGSGVATADDMAEAHASEARGVPSVSEAPPPVQAEKPAQDDDVLRSKANALSKQLQADHPEAWGQVKEWAKERNFARVADLSGPALKGFVRKLEKTLDTAGATDGEA